MLSIVTWKWTPQHGYRSRYSGDQVNTLRRMVARCYPKPHRFICVTDDPKGIADDVEIVPLWDDYRTMISKHGVRNPSCYRRLKAFSVEAREWFGDRFLSIDLDMVLVGDVSPIFDRPEDFIIWSNSTMDKRTHYNGSLWMMNAGARRQVWDEFDPKVSPQAAWKAGCFGSDQAWISYRLGPGEATWTPKDGVYSYRVHIARQMRGKLPPDARIVAFHGHVDPWSHQAQQLEWVRAHYR